MFTVPCPPRQKHTEVRPQPRHLAAGELRLQYNIRCSAGPSTRPMQIVHNRSCVALVTPRLVSYLRSKLLVAGMANGEHDLDTRLSLHTINNPVPASTKRICKLGDSVPADHANTVFVDARESLKALPLGNNWIWVKIAGRQGSYGGRMADSRDGARVYCTLKDQAGLSTAIVWSFCPVQKPDASARSGCRRWTGASGDHSRPDKRKESPSYTGRTEPTYSASIVNQPTIQPYYDYTNDFETQPHAASPFDDRVYPYDRPSPSQRMRSDDVDPFQDETAIPMKGRTKLSGSTASVAPMLPHQMDDPFVRDVNQQKQTQGSSEQGWFRGKITWIVYVLTVVQLIVFIVEIIKNGEYPRGAHDDTLC
nr:hypothetical protein CFP56_03054 [Quercus suber]